MNNELPTKFSDLKPEELFRSAVEDFAVDVEPGDSKKVILAALHESGVEWSDYVAQHPEVLPEESEVVVEAPVQSTVVVAPEPEVVEVRVQEKLDTSGELPFLIKMERDNPLFETRGYRFTRENPYALVNPRDAEHILREEDGFRQAYPSELEEYYS